MKISIIIPSFNRAKFLSKTIESIIQQAYPRYEIIVVDNNSTDGTLAMLNFYQRQLGKRFQYIHEPDRGFADAVNKGLAIATGDILSIQSSDDYYAPDAFKFVADVYAADTPLLVTGDRIGVDEELNTVRYMQSKRDINLANLLMEEVVIYQDATFFSREAYQRVGPLAATADFVADYAYWIQILSLGPGQKIDRILSFYTSHVNQRSRLQQQRFGDDYEKCVLNWIDSDLYRSMANKIPRQIPLSSILLKKAYWYQAAGKKKESRRFIEEAFKRYPDCKKWAAFQSAAWRSGGLPLFIKHFGPGLLARKTINRLLFNNLRAKSSAQGALPDHRWLCSGKYL